MFYFTKMFRPAGYYRVWEMPRVHRGARFTLELRVEGTLEEALEYVEEHAGKRNYLRVTRCCEGKVEHIISRFGDHYMTDDPKEFLKRWLDAR